MDFLRDFRPSGTADGEVVSVRKDGDSRSDWKPTSEVVLGLADLAPADRGASTVSPHGAV